MAAILSRSQCVKVYNISRVQENIMEKLINTKQNYLNGHEKNMVSSLKYIDTYSFKLGNFEAPLRYFKLTRNFYIDFICV